MEKTPNANSVDDSPDENTRRLRESIDAARDRIQRSHDLVTRIERQQSRPKT